MQITTAAEVPTTAHLHKCNSVGQAIINSNLMACKSSRTTLHRIHLRAQCSTRVPHTGNTRAQLLTRFRSTRRSTRASTRHIVRLRLAQLACTHTLTWVDKALGRGITVAQEVALRQGRLVRVELLRLTFQAMRLGRTSLPIIQPVQFTSKKTAVTKKNKRSLSDSKIKSIFS